MTPEGFVEISVADEDDFIVMSEFRARFEAFFFLAVYSQEDVSDISELCN